MKFKYKLLFVCVIFTLISLIQTFFLNSKEGYENLNDNEVTFAQYSKKYGHDTGCLSAPFEEIGIHVEVMKSIQVMKTELDDGSGLSDGEVVEKYLREKTYEDIWTPGTISAIHKNDNNNKYDIIYSDSAESTESNVEEVRIKSHHQNVCKICRNSVDDNQCTDDCREPNVYLNTENDIIVESAGNCLPVEKGKDADGNEIDYQLCPFVCKNGEKQLIDLVCSDDNCCFGCGYSIFEMECDNSRIRIDEDGKEYSETINSPGRCKFKNKLNKIPDKANNYSISTNGGVDNVKSKQDGGLNDIDYGSASTGGDGASTGGDGAGTGGDGASTGGDGASTGTDAENDSSNAENNVMNAFNDDSNCWLGPTGHKDFMYCGPAPYYI